MAHPHRLTATTTATLAALCALAGCGHTSNTTTGSRSTEATHQATSPGTATVTPTATTTPHSGITPGDGEPGPTNPDIAPGVPGSYLDRQATATDSEVPTSDGPGESTAAVTVLNPTTSDDNALATAAWNYNGCKPYTVKGTVHIATIKASGVSWAIAGINGPTNCVGAWFYDTSPPPAVGVFYRQSGAPWQFSSEAGKPFPCPLPQGGFTGNGSPYVPAEVLQAWQIPYYSSNCLPKVPQDHG